MSALSLYQLLLTGVVELGLGFTAWIGIAKIVPYVRGKKESEARETMEYTSTFWTTRNPLIWIVQPHHFSFAKPHEVTITRKEPMRMNWYIRWGALQALAWIVTLGILADLLTSKGWELPFFQHFEYNMFYAVANNAPNGAHITSYLTIVMLTVFVAAKTKDIFLGGLSGALLVALHELIWIGFYYTAWGQYVNAGMITNILKDFPIFTGMLVLFLIGFAKYPYQKWKLSEFKIPLMIYTAYLVAWFFLPHLINPSYYQFLPIRTANLPSSLTSATVTQWNETKYFNDFLTNAIEVFGWYILFVSMMIVFARKKI
ncbi:MAG: hypothetical protein JRN15_05030 [Nitrososphaerota archaeon]|nr:hypothetical protein [Nitrososphaerota archaeon]